MKRLLRLECIKNLNYWPFKIFIVLYFIILTALLFIGLVDFNFLEIKINLKQQGMYNFPGIWNFTTYFVSLLKIFLGCIIVFSICQEFSNRMFKQNIIDGLSRQEFITSKLLMNLVFTSFSTILVLVITFILGKSYSTTQDIDSIFKEIFFIFNYFLKLFSFFSFLMFLSIVFRKSIFVFLIFFIYWIAEKILFLVENYILVKNTNLENNPILQSNQFYITDYLPLNSMSELIPNPLIRTRMAEVIELKFDFQYPWGSVIACIIWTVIFIYGSYWTLKKKDW